MRIVIFPVSNGQPDYEPFGGIGDFGETEVVRPNCIGQYFGSANETLLPNHSSQVWPLPKYRTQVTFQEFVDLFGSQNWVKVEELVETSNAGSRILKWMEKQTGTFSINNAEVITLLNAIDTNTTIDTAEIRKGVPE